MYYVKFDTKINVKYHEIFSSNFYIQGMHYVMS